MRTICQCQGPHFLVDIPQNIISGSELFGASPTAFTMQDKKLWVTKLQRRLCGFCVNSRVPEDVFCGAVQGYIDEFKQMFSQMNAKVKKWFLSF